MKQNQLKTNQDFQPVGEILKKFDPYKAKYVSQEFQDYGYRLAQELGDLKHKALYIKMAKELPRGILEEARNFVKDANNVKNPAKLFMWKLEELKTQISKRKTKT